jgi:hypothetical protein
VRFLFRFALLVFVLESLFGGILPSAAGAAPTLGIGVSREPTPVRRSDESLDYKVELSNTSPTTATCNPKTWTGTPAPSFSYRWLRDGIAIGGATSETYSPVAADENHSLQCQVTGANTTVASGTGITTAGSRSVTGVSGGFSSSSAGMTISGAGIPTGTRIVSFSGSTLTLSTQATASASGVPLSGTISNAAGEVSAPVFYGSQPAIPPPAPGTPTLGAARPTVATEGSARKCTPPTNWNGAPTWTFQWLRNGSPIAAASGTVSTNSDSITLNAVTTAAGSGELTSGSKNVTGLIVTTGSFRIGQTVSGTGVPAGAKVESVGPGTLELSVAATATGIQALTAGSQPFSTGEAISGAGIPAGTTIVAVNGQTITLSAAATATATGVAVSATATGEKYTPYSASGEEDQNTVFQCMVLGTNASGKAAGLSNNNNIGSPISPPANAVAETPTTSGAEWTSGAIALAAAAPGGMTFAACTGTGWTAHITAQNCTSATAIRPGGVSTVTIREWLSPEVPELVTTKFTAVGGGTTTDTIAQDSFTLAPAEVFGLIGSASGTANMAAGSSSLTNVVAGSGSFVPRQEIVGAGIPVGTTITAVSGSTLTLSSSVIVSGTGTGVAITATGFTAGAEENALGVPDHLAGAHPFSVHTYFAPRRLRTALGGERPTLDLRDAIFELPPGFVANPQATPSHQCSVQMLPQKQCPQSSAVGGLKVVTTGIQAQVAVFQAIPPRGYPAAFVFEIQEEFFTILPKLSGENGYSISAITPLVAQEPKILQARVVLCGYGANVEYNGNGIGAIFVSCKAPGEVATEAPFTDADKVPFLTNPTSCPGTSTITKAHVDSWQEPGRQLPSGLPNLSDPAWKTEEAISPPNTGCDTLEFTPTIEGQPTTSVADSPSGLDFDLRIPQEGLEKPSEFAPADLEDSTVTLPRGVAVNPASANGLAACSPAQIGLKTEVGKSPVRFNDEPVSCPEASKLGTVETETPLLDHPLHGVVYLAHQGDNPFGSLIALYIVVDDPDTGILVKLAGKVTPDPVSGQIVARFEENPQLPFESLSLHFFEGPGGSLRTPAVCGKSTITTELTPWSGTAPATPSSSFQITSAPSGGACPTNVDQLRNAPSFSAGTMSSKAGSYSPFVLHLTREGDTQELKGLNVTLPEGLTGRLAGITRCSEAQIAQVRGRSGLGEGAMEESHPSCPAASEVGTVTAGAGAGEIKNLYYTQGHVYLAGPYKGAPVSMVIVVPAVAGPFDLGTVVVRSPLYINPETAQVTVKAEEIPTILKGIPLDVRSITVKVDRSRFTLNPTSCEQKSVTGTAFGASSNAPLSDRFQVGECAALSFKPNLKLKLKGGTQRGDHPALTATLTYPEGAYANIKSASVALPHSEFLAQEHIKTICTRVQFAAHACPTGSIYGSAEAMTPLLDQPLRGNVYLRSSSHSLPDLVVSLRGPESQPIEVDLVGRVDSVHGGIRNTFEMVPDAPVSKFVLKMQGGKKGLLVNSRNICGKPGHASAGLIGQNGKRRDLRPELTSDCGKAGKKHKGRQKHASHRLDLAAWGSTGF